MSTSWGVDWRHPCPGLPAVSLRWPSWGPRAHALAGSFWYSGLLRAGSLAVAEPRLGQVDEVGRLHALECVCAVPKAHRAGAGRRRFLMLSPSILGQVGGIV